MTDDTRNDMDRKGLENRTEGSADELKGRVRSAAGDLTGDKSQQLKGEAEQLKGQAKQKLGEGQQRMNDDR